MAQLATIPPPPLQELSLGPLSVHVYGLLIATGAALAMVILRRRYTAFGGDPELADRLSLWVLVLGFLGARGAYVLPRVGEFVDRPLAIFAIWEGGLALFGGLTVGTLAAILLLRRWGGDLPAFADAIAPALPVAQAVGRWGNYFNQELYGTPTNLPWALEVEPQFRVAAYQQFATFHPTFLYESLWNLALAGGLVLVGRRSSLRRGTLVFLYAAGYGLMRFLLELLRTDTTFRLLGLSRNAYVALVVVAIGVAGAIVHHRRGLLPAPAAADPAIVDPGTSAEAPNPPGEDTPTGLDAEPGGAHGTGSATEPSEPQR